MPDPLLCPNLMRQSLLDAATEVCIWLFDRTGKILFANLTAARRFGRSPEEMTGKHAADFLPRHLCEARLARIKMVLDSGEPLRFEDVHDGVHIRHNLSPVLDDGAIAAVACYSHDISLPKKLEVQRHQSDEKLLDGERKLRVEVHMEHDKLIRRTEVLELIGLSHSTQWRLEKAGRFPARVRLGIGSVGWHLAEVEEWVRERERVAVPPKAAPLEGGVALPSIPRQERG